jgi:pimeloyl-ACP methyl ester carboxylesterase
MPTPSLHILEVGPVDAPTLVFLHGGGGAGWMWKPQIDALSADYHCLVPDLPEHGQSMGVDPFTIADVAQRVAHLIAARAHDQRAHLIGLSLGAQVGVALLAIAPECLHSALISSALLRPLPGAAMYNNSALLRWIFKLSVAPLQHSAWYARLNMRQSAGVPDIYFPQFREEFQRMTADSFANVMVENMKFRLPSDLDKTLTRTLVVVGRKEYKAMRQSACDLVKALPKAKGVLVDVGRRTAENHNWNLTAPELFTQTVRAFIEESALPGELKPFEC